MKDEVAVLIVTPEIAQKLITDKEVFYWAKMPDKSFQKIIDAVEKIQEEETKE